jgi:hypothetical protein
MENFRGFGDVSNWLGQWVGGEYWSQVTVRSGQTGPKKEMEGLLG